jgi:hypothetical protein
MKQAQSNTFNQTARQKIPAKAVGWEFDKHRSVLHVTSICRGVAGKWCERVDASLLQDAVVHFDIRSLLYQERKSRRITDGVLDDGWQGLEIPFQRAVLESGCRVKMEISVCLPEAHREAGRIVASAEEMVILAGDDGSDDDDGNGSGSLLSTKPDRDLKSLCQLDITHTGPKLLVNSAVDGVTWHEIATDPCFKFGLFSACVERVLIHIALSDHQPWMDGWLELDGVGGAEHEVEAEDTFVDAYEKAQVWARACAQKVAMARNLLELFKIARKRQATG